MCYNLFKYCDKDRYNGGKKRTKHTFANQENKTCITTHKKQHVG